MPHDSFEREWQDSRGHPLYERVIKVKRIFHVSYKTVLIHLVQMEEASRDVFWTFHVQHQRRFGQTLKKVDEPLPLTKSKFNEKRELEPDRLSDTDCLDDRLRSLVRQAVESDEISLSRGAEILRMSLGHMRCLIARGVLLSDADVLIDYRDLDLSILALVVQHSAPVHVVRDIVDEVDDLNFARCRELGLTVIEADPEVLLQLATLPRRLSRYDRLSLQVCRDNDWTCVTNDRLLRRICGEHSVRTK